MRRQPTALLVLPVVATLAAALAGCSGSGPDPVPSRAAEAAGPFKPGAPCDKQGFGTHAALAAGAVRTFVWTPFSAGAFARSAKGRAEAVRDAAGASALAAREMKAAAPLVAGCEGSVILVNALTTGTSLATAAHGQLAQGAVNAQTLAGVNSALGTVAAQSARIGIRVEPAATTRAQVLAAG